MPDRTVLANLILPDRSILIRVEVQESPITQAREVRWWILRDDTPTPMHRLYPTGAAGMILQPQPVRGNHPNSNIDPARGRTHMILCALWNLVRTLGIEPRRAVTPPVTTHSNSRAVWGWAAQHTFYTRTTTSTWTR